MNPHSAIDKFKDKHIYMYICIGHYVHMMTKQVYMVPTFHAVVEQNTWLHDAGDDLYS
jgi:hypothetical protein